MIDTETTLSPDHEDAWDHASRITDALAQLFQRIHAQQGRDVDLTTRPFETPQHDERTFDQLLADVAMLAHTYHQALAAAVEPTILVREDLPPVNWIAAAADTFRALSAVSLGTEPHWVNPALNDRLAAMTPDSEPPPEAISPGDLIAPEGHRTIKQTTLPPGHYWIGDPAHMARTMDLRRLINGADEHSGLASTAHGPAAIYEHLRMTNFGVDLDDNGYHTPGNMLAAIPLAATKIDGQDAVLEGCGMTFNTPNPLLCSLREDGVATFGPLQITLVPYEATQHTRVEGQTQ